MPIAKSRLNQREASEYSAAVLRLRQMGVAVGKAGVFAQKTASRLQRNLTVEQTDPEFATIYDLPGVALAVVIPAKLLVLGSGVLIVEAEMTVPWHPLPLELEEPEHHAFFDRVIAGLIPCPPKLLYRRLTGKQNLYRGQWEGVIVGMGYSSVPLRYEEGAQAPVTLSLWDERDNKLRFTFHASVNRVFKERYEREQAKWRRSHKRIPLFSEEARRLPKIAIESHLTRLRRSLERWPRVTDESRLANGGAQQVAQSEPMEGAEQNLASAELLEQMMSSFIKQAAMQPQSRAGSPDDQNEK